MTFERFTDRARKVIQLANQAAVRLNHSWVDTGHVLLGLCKEGSGVAANVLRNLDIDIRKVQEEVEKALPESHEVGIAGKLPLTPRVKAALEQAIKESADLGHNYVGTEHLLLGLLHDASVTHSVLTNLGVEAETVREEILTLLSGTRRTAPETAANVTLTGGMVTKVGDTDSTSALIRQIGAAFTFVEKVGGFEQAKRLLVKAEKMMDAEDGMP